VTVLTSQSIDAPVRCNSSETLSMQHRCMDEYDDIGFDRIDLDRLGVTKTLLPGVDLALWLRITLVAAVAIAAGVTALGLR
jgi:hypothetical protein